MKCDKNMNSAERIIVNNIVGSVLIPKRVRNILLNMFNFKIHPTCRIMQGYFFDSSNIEIGRNTFINRFFQFHDSGRNEKLLIEDNVMIAMNVNCCAVSHKIGSSDKRGGETYTGPITIKKGCWIGANVTILNGVTIERGCIIAAGSVVIKNTAPNGLYAGVPAKRIKDLL